MSSVTIGPDKDGKEVRVTMTDVIVLKLPENPTTGVRWSFEQINGPLKQVGDEYEPPDSSSGIGAMSTRVFRLQPLGSGTARLQLKRCQEWEGDSSIDAKYSCVIDITNE